MPLPSPATTLVLAAALLCASASAAPPHPWVSAPLQLQQPRTYFTNIENEQQIETPFVLKFGLSRFGLAPIVKPTPGTGHHHLLVNRELPLDFKQPLPFNDQYIHFGKGQMETVLTFPPGRYNLRLLLADDKHIPHFIYSKPVTVVVTKKNEGVDPKSLITPGVMFLAPARGASLKPPFLVAFHASGLNVGHASVTEPGVGHFRIVAERPGTATEHIEYANGETETWLAPPPGDYKLRLEFVRNAAPADVMATSPPLELRVSK